MQKAGFIWVLGCPQYPNQSVVVFDPMLCPERHPETLVANTQGWTRAGSVAVENVASNLRELAGALGLGAVTQGMHLGLAPERVLQALARVAHGRLDLEHSNLSPG